MQKNKLIRFLLIIVIAAAVGFILIFSIWPIGKKVNKLLTCAAIKESDVSYFEITEISFRGTYKRYLTSLFYRELPSFQGTISILHEGSRKEYPLSNIGFERNDWEQWISVTYYDEAINGGKNLGKIWADENFARGCIAIENDSGEMIYYIFPVMDQNEALGFLEEINAYTESKK